jgi:hypothetical protein
MFSLDARLSVALTLFVIGLLFVLLRKFGWISGNKVKRIGPYAMYASVGLCVPFDWWPYIGAPSWVGIPLFVGLGFLGRVFYQNFVEESPRVRARRRS